MMFTMASYDGYIAAEDKYINAPERPVFILSNTTTIDTSLCAEAS